MSNCRTRYAQDTDAEQLIALANEVQAALTNSGSLQQIGPLSRADVEQACKSRYCFLIEESHPGAGILGCAFVMPLSDEAGVSHELGVQGLDSISHLEIPWLYLHTIMLRPSSQGRRIGALLVDDFLRRWCRTMLEEADQCC